MLFGRYLTRTFASLALCCIVSIGLPADAQNGDANAAHPDENKSGSQSAQSADAKPPRNAVGAGNARPGNNDAKSSPTSQPASSNDPGAKPAVNPGTAGGAGKSQRAVGHGKVEGKVFSAETDQALIGATVVLAKQEGGGERREELSGFDGSFSFKNVESGNWVVTASSDGMFTHSEKISVQSDQSQSVKFVLKPLEGTDVLRITGKRTLIHPEKIGSTTHVPHDLIYQYGSGNDLRADIQTTPGVLADTFGNVIVRGEHNALNYVVDGVVLPEAAGVLQQGQFVSPRSLQSMDVNIGGYEASDGGGPLGAVVHMRSLPIERKPTFNLGTQIGGPMAGAINFYGSTALSQNPNSLLGRIAVESSGAIVATKLGLQPPVKHFKRDGRLDINVLNKVEFRATERDTFKLTAGINETFLHIPTPGFSRSFGVKLNEHDRQNYIILTHRHKFVRWFDESHLHVLTAFYSQRLNGTNVFDPEPILNGEQLVQSVVPNAKRLNFAVGLQGDISKTALKSHHLLAGFLTELRPVKTQYSAWYYNANPLVAASSSAESAKAGEDAIADALANGATQEVAAAAGAAAAAAIPVIPYGGMISPFTQAPGGLNLQGNLGKFKGFRYLQSAYIQDSWRPSRGFLRRLTLDAGVRADVYVGVFGNTLPLAYAVAAIPDIPAFDLTPFKRQTVGNGQASGRFGGAFVVTKDTVIRGSFSNIFTPPPVDLLVRPFDVTAGTINGVWNGAIRPMHATRGNLVDVSIEKQIGPRVATRTNLFYKKLIDVGDELPLDNTVLYQRLTLSGLESYGVETRIDLRPDRDGYGLNGFLSNTVSIAYLRGNKKDTGGIFDVDPEPNFDKYIDHDRRENLTCGLGYRSRSNFWILTTLSVWTGFLDGRNPEIFGGHPARSPVVTLMGVNAGYQLPKERQRYRWLPVSVDVRIENVMNQALPINLGSPFQGTRYALPIRVLAGMNWKV